MAERISAVVFRYDPDTDQEPRYQEYLVDADEKMSVLVLLDRIQKNLDETLSFRSYCCGLQMCRSCLMEINGKKQFACLFLVAPGERVTIAPWSFPSGHVKDLVVESDKREREER